MKNKLKIGLDVGGVLSKYPEIFKKLISLAQFAWYYVEIHIISDMHDVKYIQNMLIKNEIYLDKQYIHSADYKKYGEYCKAKLCKELEIDIMIDDFVGYLADEKHIRLLVMPDSSKPYYSPEWKTDGSEGDFGRHAFRRSK